MASLRTTMDATFWDLDVSTPHTLEGSVRYAPGEPVPVGMARSSRLVRPQQLPLVAGSFPLGLVPSLAPTPHKGLGSLALSSVLYSHSSDNWWAALVGQIRPAKVINGIKSIGKELSQVKLPSFSEEIELPSLQEIKQFGDKAVKSLDASIASIFALGLFSQFSPLPSTNLLFNVEGHGDRKGRRTRAMLIHNLPEHDITLEAAWPGLYTDSKGNYWSIPNSLSLDISSLISHSGFRYRFGLHRTGGQPKPAFNQTEPADVAPPVSLMSGICAKAAFSLEKNRDFWRESEKKRPYKHKFIEKGEDGKPRLAMPSYDDRLKEPHSAVSGIIGGTCEAWLGTQNKFPFNLDLFGSLCYTIQHGRFKKDFNDLTRLDARLDVVSGSAFIEGTGRLISDIVRRRRVDRKVDPLASPRLNLTFQQQVSGPLIFRVDSRISPSSPSGDLGPYIEDIMYGLTYSLIAFRSGKVVAWYSPKRKEAMVELRFFEF